jgi:hypothetical protein
MFRSAAAFLLVAVLMSEPVFAAERGHAHGPRHGGVAREVGEVTYELVVKPDVMTLNVFDHGKPGPMRDASAKATVYAGNDRTTVKPSPAGENTLAAKASFKSGVGVRVAVNMMRPRQKELRLTFNLK